MEYIIQTLFFTPEPLMLPLFVWAYLAYLVLIDIGEMIEWVIEEIRWK